MVVSQVTSSSPHSLELLVAHLKALFSLKDWLLGLLAIDIKGAFILDY
jgi:hypothetical protein